MNLSRCQKGHFYDAEKYSSCPHCMGGAGADNSLTAAFTDDLTVPNNGLGGETVPNSVFEAQPQQFTPVQPMVQPMMQPSSSMFPVADFPADQPTMPMEGIIPGESLTVPLETDSTEPISDVWPTEDTDHTVGYYDDSDLFGSGGSLEQASSPVNKPVAPPKPMTKLGNPCVGWLVALGGKHLGTDFRLKVGKNFIGRSPQMDVALINDMSVSREKHAIVVYEPKEHLYLVQPGEASTLVYKNEAVVLDPTRLEAYDVISVGDVNLLFIPLCNKQFNWSDLLEELRKNN